MPLKQHDQKLFNAMTEALEPIVGAFIEKMREAVSPDCHVVVHLFRRNSEGGFDGVLHSSTNPPEVLAATAASVANELGRVSHELFKLYEQRVEAEDGPHAV
jgi:hypothetical protein